MAAEGYAFAKLPKCYLMPQLQDWIMYREGVVFSETDKSILMAELRCRFSFSFLIVLYNFLLISFFPCFLRKFDASNPCRLGFNRQTSAK